MDYKKGTSKGFAFVEYEEADDATEAIYNRHGSQLLGRTLTVNMAQASQATKLTNPTEAVWQGDEWFQQQQQQQQQQEEEEEEEKGKKDDGKEGGET